MWLYASVPAEAFRFRVRERQGAPALRGLGAMGTPSPAPGLRPATPDQRQPTDRGDLISTKEATIELEGEVTEALRNGMFRIKLDNGHETIGYVAGKMRRYRIRIMLGDRIKIQLSPYDLNRGRIVYRYK